MAAGRRGPTLTAVEMTEFERERLLTDALVYEGQQHWLHYRHIEQERNQFLGFFFTLLVAIVGFFVAVSSRLPSWPVVALGLTCMAAVFGLISVLIFASVRKFGAALHAYDRDIERIRGALLARADPGRTHLVSERTSMRPTSLHPLFDPQFAAEAIVGTFAVVAYAVQLFVAAETLVTGDFSAGQQGFACVLAAVSTAGVVTAVRLWLRHDGPGARAVKYR
jgi:hypothetical protein